jgi:hypothetical protein
MVNTTKLMKSARRRYLLVPAGMLLVISPYSYHARELLTCWMFFALLLVSVTPAIVVSVLVYYAGKWIVHWAWDDGRGKVTPALGLSVSPLRPIRPKD